MEDELLERSIQAGSQGRIMEDAVLRGWGSESAPSFQRRQYP